MARLDQKFGWLELRDAGLYCAPADIFIDPSRGVPNAIITHGHADHARPGHGKVLATPETLAIMGVRYPTDTPVMQALTYGERLTIGGVKTWLAPAGHVLGSAQVALEYGGERIVISGDYKRRPDPTAAAFEVIKCDLFITEATFALPVFRHPPAAQEVQKLLTSIAQFPEQAHVLGVYGLGKCQRMLSLVREAGFGRPIYLHGALVKLTDLYKGFGFDFGDVRPVAGTDKAELATALIFAPASAIQDKWSRRFQNPRTAVASGWMRVRARARQRGAELPLVISDHADWDELLTTCQETGAEEVWITHGREDALAHALIAAGQRARPLRLAGREEEAA